MPTFFVGKASGIGTYGLVGVGTSVPTERLDVNGYVGAGGAKIATSGYVNFGAATGTTGYGFHDNAGTMQYKDNSGSWINLSSLGGAGAYVPLSGGTMTGPLYVGFDTATASLHIKNAGGGNALVIDAIGNTIATSSLFVITDNTNASSNAILARTTGAGSAGYFQVSNAANGTPALFGESNGNAASVAVYGVNIGSGNGGYFRIANAGNSASALLTNTTGTGRLLELQKSSSALFAVDNSGNMWASGTIVQASGYMNFGTIAGTTGYGFRDNAGNVEVKDSLGGWTQISTLGGAGTYVAKAGDTMSGALGLTQAGATATIYAYQTGATNQAGYFAVTDFANTSDAVYITSNSNSAGLGLNVFHSGSNGGAARFETTGGLNSQDTLYAKSNSNSGGAALNAIHSGSSGLAGRFQTNNFGNSTNTVYIISNSNAAGGNGLMVDYTGGGGNAALFRTNNGASAFPALRAVTNGDAPAASFVNSNTTHATNTVFVGSYSSDANSAGLRSINDGTGGYSGYFNNSNNVNNESAIFSMTNGQGHAGHFVTMLGANPNSTVYITNNSGSGLSSLLAGNHTGSGAIMDFATNSARVFYVDNNAVMFASGTVVNSGGYMNFGGASGSGGYGFRDIGGTLQYKNNGGGWASFGAGSFVAKTGDTMSGGLAINTTAGSSIRAVSAGASSATTTLYVETDNADSNGFGLYASQTGAGASGYFQISNGGNAKDAVTGQTNGSGVAVYGYNIGSGRAGDFTINNVGSGADALYASTNGAGRAIYASKSLSGDLIYGSLTAGGHFVKFMNGNPFPMFAVDYSGNVFASGAVVANGSYLNFGGTAGAAGYGLRDNGGTVEYRNNAGVWTNIGAGNFVSKAGDSMTGPLVINYNTATASLHINNNSNGNVAVFKQTGLSAATSSVYIYTNNFDTGSVGLNVEHSGNGGAAIFSNSFNSNATSTVLIASNSGMPGNGALRVINYGTEGNALTVSGTNSLETTLSVNGALFAVNSATATAYFNNANQNTGSKVLHVRNDGNGAAALFENNFWNNSTATVAISSSNQIAGTKTLKVINGGITGTALDVSGENSDEPTARFTGMQFNPAMTNTVEIANSNAESRSSALYVNAGQAGSAAMFETPWTNHATASVSITTRSNMTNNRALDLYLKGFSGNGLQVRSDTTDGYLARFVNDSINPTATATVMMANAAGNNDTEVLRAESMGLNGVAVFNTRYFNNATPTVSIWNSSNNANSNGLKIVKKGFSGTGLIVQSSTTDSPLAIFNATNADATVANTVKIFTERNAQEAAGLYVEQYDSGAAAVFESDNWFNNNSTSTVRIASRSNNMASIGLFVEHRGFAGRALVVNTTSSNSPVATFGFKSAGGSATSAVYISADNLNTDSEAFKVVNKSQGSAAVFSNIDVWNATPTIFISNESNEMRAAALQIRQNALNAPAALIEETAIGAATATLIVNKRGMGDIAVFSKSGAPKFIVDSDGNVFASGTVFGGMSGGSFVSKAGDNMFGGLYMGFNTATATLHIKNIGGGNSLYIDDTGAAAATSALYVNTDNTNSGSYGIQSITTGNGMPGLFRINNMTNSSDAVQGYSNGTGNAVAGYASASGRAGYFESLDNANANTALTVQSNSNVGNSHTVLAAKTGGGGSAGFFEINNAANPDEALYASTNGTGLTAYFSNTNAANNLATLGVDTNGNGAALYGSTTGAGNAGRFEISNGGNGSEALLATTNGSGSAGSFQIANAGSANNALLGTTNGSGAALFTSNTGTGRAAMVSISAPGNAAEALFVSTSGSGSAGAFGITNAANASTALTATTNGTGGVGNFTIWNIANAQPVLFAQTDGTGTAVAANTSGTGSVGSFSNSNGANSANALYVYTNGTGNAGRFELDSAGSINAAISAFTSGIGNAGKFQVSNTANTNDAMSISTNSNSAGGKGLRVANSGTGDMAAIFTISNGGNTSPVILTDSAGTGNLIQVQQGGSDKLVVGNKGKLSMPDTNVAGRATITGGTNCKLVNTTEVTGSSAVLVTPISNGTGTFGGLRVQAITAASSFNVCTMDGTNVPANTDFSYLVIN
ncbi:MAG: hypothetical protein WCX65_13625 [bacterium]